MFRLYADKNKLTILQREAVTSGSVNVYMAGFEFSPDWAGLRRKAVFKAGKETRTMLLDDSGQCVIPWEVLSSHGQPLMAGVFGTQDETVLPTVWANLGTILEGAAPGPEAGPPTPELWRQELDQKGDRLAVTEDGALGLYAGDKLLSEVPIPGGGGEGGTSDHRALTHRDAEGQHPIASITGLERELSRRATADDALSVVDIIKIMEG